MELEIELGTLELLGIAGELSRIGFYVDLMVIYRYDGRFSHMNGSSRLIVSLD